MIVHAPFLPLTVGPRKSVFSPEGERHRLVPTSRRRDLGNFARKGGASLLFGENTAMRRPGRRIVSRWSRRAPTGNALVDRYAGNSIRFATSAGGPVSREIYSATNGALQVVDMDRDLIQSGTWSAGSGSDFRTLGFTTLGIQNGATFRTDSEERVAMNVNVLPDGTASVFTRTSERPMVATQPKPAARLSGARRVRCPEAKDGRRHRV
jgi:hypothetical protein